MGKGYPVFLLLLLTCCLTAGIVPARGVKLQDDLGMEVELGSPPQRIVSLAPSNTELLFALGLGEKVVGVTEVCTYPEAVLEIEKVADYNSISVEKIVAAKPDLVLAARGNNMEGVESLRKLGIKVFGLDIQSIDQLLRAIERLGQLCGAEPQAARLKKELEGRVQKVTATVASLEERPRVMWGYWGDPVYTAGARTMIDDVFHLAGGINVGRQAKGAWPQVGLEAIVSWAPEVIITTYHPHAGDPVELGKDIERLQQTDGWKSLPAVRQGRVYFVDPDLLLRPGPRLIDALEQVAACLHPEALAAP